MRYLIFIIYFFLLNSCFCSDAKEVGYPEKYTGPNSKDFTIVNHTNRTYKKNTLCAISPLVSKGKALKFQYVSHKINTINPKEKKINKNEKGKRLILWKFEGCNRYSRRWENDNLFLFSLNGGEKKVFFGAYNYDYEDVYDFDDCEKRFIRWDVHPVWREKDLTIHIKEYENKNIIIEFSDPKIKEVKKICLERVVDHDKIRRNEKLDCNQEVDPNTLPLVDCSKE